MSSNVAEESGGDNLYHKPPQPMEKPYADSEDELHMKKRRVFASATRTVGLLAVALLNFSGISAQTPQQLPRPKAAAPASAGLIEDLVTAYRILAAEGIFDA